MKNGEVEIAENEAKLADARKEYEEGKKTSEAEIAKGEKKLADAGKQISQIKNPKWYLYDRSTLTEYDGFGENADRMRAIGKVFPVMFFLVAALISLTGMTRMVEEQRIEIGTMKALGYGNFPLHRNIWDMHSLQRQEEVFLEYWRERKSFRILLSMHMRSCILIFRRYMYHTT